MREHLSLPRGARASLTPWLSIPMASMVAGWTKLPLTILLLAACTATHVASAADGERIIVANARLIGRDTPEQDLPVSLLIVDGRLTAVTRDELVVQPGDIAVDASGGFLFGQLPMGSPPSFVILDRDPRDDFDVLLDTGGHVRFAMRDGTIVMNELPALSPSPSEETAKPRRWKAYTPPPIAVPIRYFDSRKWNKFETRSISGLFTGAVVLDRQYWLSQDAASRDQVGDLSDYEGGEIRAFRAGVVGTLNFKRPWGYTIFLVTNTFDKGFDVDTTDELGLFDYRLDIPLPADLMLSVGKQKEPISMERLMPLSFLPMQERSTVADALLPARNHGVVLSGTGGEWFTWAVGGFNNWIDSGESFSDTSSQLVSRATWVPAVSEDESNLLHLGLGLRYSDAKQPIRAGTEPEFNNAPNYVDTGSFSADSVMTYNLEAYWRKGPWWVGFEYLGSDVKSPESGNPYFSGYHLTASWAVTGETRAYRKRSGTFDPLPVARPVTRGGWGALELAFRYSVLDLTDGAVDGGDLEILSLGANWWLSPSAYFGVDYRYITLDRFGIQGNSSGLCARMMLILN